MYYFLLSRKRSNKGGDATFFCWNEAIWQDYPSLHLSGKHNSANLVSYLQPKWGPSLINRFKTHIHSYLHTSSRYFLLCTYTHIIKCISPPHPYNINTDISSVIKHGLIRAFYYACLYLIYLFIIHQYLVSWAAI